MVVVENYGIDVFPDESLTRLADRLEKFYLDPIEVKQRLTLVEDELFQSLVSIGTEIVTRVRLNDNTKAVAEGPWTEELLPAESLLASFVLCDDAARERGPGGSHGSD